MNNFKKFLFQDINTFINLDEFANVHEVNGIKVACIFDEDINKERNINKESQNFNGVFSDSISLFIRKEDLQIKPLIDEKMTIDSDLYIVQNISESDNIYEIEIVRNEY